MEMYLEYAIGNPKNRGKLCKVSEIPRIIKEAQDRNDELYRSYFQYDEEILDHLKIRKTMRNYRGKLYLGNQILFDIDKGTNTNEYTLSMTRDFINQLFFKWKVDKNSIVVWFSGTGYHVVIPDVFGFEPSNELPKIMKATFAQHFPGIDTSILTTTGLIRVGNTINNKSQLYKVGFNYETFNKIELEDIFATAKEPDNPLSPITLTGIGTYKDKIIYPSDYKTKTSEDNLTSVVTCMQKLWNDPPDPGTRHMKMLRLASHFRRQGVPQSALKLMLKEWIPSMEPYEIERTVDDIFEKEYTRFGCHDPIMAHYCDPRCIFYRDKNYTPDVMTSVDAEKKYVEYLRNNVDDRSINIGALFHMEFDCWMRPGEFIVVEGDTGIGKTAFVQNLLLKTEYPSLYITTEVPSHLLYRRNLQIKNGVTKAYLDDYYKTHTNSLSKAVAFIKVAENIRTTSEIDKAVLEHDMKVLVIDALEDIRYIYKPGEKPSGDEIGDVARHLKAVAEQHGIVVIVIHHISKNAARDPFGKVKEMNVHSGKGSSTVEQKADKVIAVEGDPTTTFRKVKTTKSRDENHFSESFNMNPETFRYIHLTA